MPSLDRSLPVALAVLALVAVLLAVPVASPAYLGYGCGGGYAVDFDRTDDGQWLVLQIAELPPDGGATVVVRNGGWDAVERHDVQLPANDSVDEDPEERLYVVGIVPEGDGWWILASDGTAYAFDGDGSFAGERRPVSEFDDDDPAVSAPADAIDWEDEQYGDAVDVESADDRNYVLAKDGTVLAYTERWQYSGVTHEGVDGNDCYGERPAWPSAWQLLVASNAVGLVGLALASVLARDDLELAAALAVGGPVVAATFSMSLLPDAVGVVYRLPDLGIGIGLLAPVAAAGRLVDEDPVVAVPLLVACGATLVTAGVRYLLASGFV